MHLEPNVLELVQAFHDNGGTAIVVGGAVRDHLLGTRSSDIDIEVHNLEWDHVTSICKSLFIADLCGESFAVLKLHGADIDVSIPRREVCTGESHQDFDVTADPYMGFAEAASRRDFTVNTIGFNPLTGELVDPHGGVADLETGVLRHVSHRFAEDALRVMRGAQFASRFGMTMAPETVQLCQTLDAASLPQERTSAEWMKLLNGASPSKGLEALATTGWLNQFPELDGINLEATKLRLDALAGGSNVQLWSGLLLDRGKDARKAIRSLSGFEKISSNAQAIIDHLDQLAPGSELRRTATALGGLRDVLAVASSTGRDITTAAAQADIEDILDQKPQPLISGGDLISQGFVPGPELGILLRRLLDLQFEEPSLSKAELLATIK